MGTLRIFSTEHQQLHREVSYWILVFEVLMHKILGFLWLQQMQDFVYKFQNSVYKISNMRIFFILFPEYLQLQDFISSKGGFEFSSYTKWQKLSCT